MRLFYIRIGWYTRANYELNIGYSSGGNDDYIEK
ncbi:MAG: hypothetical protein K0R69_2536 [Clostridia bacterium]|jgi:hypothetical protein|nr:hypothetical protein [Clostridia bacterium]